VNEFHAWGGRGGAERVSYVQTLEIRPGPEVSERNSHYIHLKFNFDIIFPTPVPKEFSSKSLVSISKLLYKTLDNLTDIHYQ
jgi:hypothetical protein